MARVRGLGVLAGLTWYAGAFALLSKGTRLLLEAEGIIEGQLWPWVAFGVGILVGTIKARQFLFKSCRKNLERIAHLEEPRWWQFFRPRFFAALAVMIAVGVASSRAVAGHYAGLCVVGAVDLSVGSGLFLSGLAFFSTRGLAPAPSVAGSD